MGWGSRSLSCPLDRSWIYRHHFIECKRLA
jgi:hypothetical protein